MPARKESDALKSLKHNPKGGDTEAFPSGRVTYLAPLPLPTSHPAKDYHRTVGALNEAYLVYGSSKALAFWWQVVFGVPFTMFVIMLVLLPCIAAVGAFLLGGNSSDISAFYHNTLSSFTYVAPIGSLVVLGVLLLAWKAGRSKERHLIPPRFNRQRREVCFVPTGESEVYIVPWESLSAWTTEARGVTQYGVQRQFALGIGFHHKGSGRDCIVEYPYPATPLAISAWEAIRAYMEYEVNSLEDIHVADDLHKPSDPPYEGRHTFLNARLRVHRRYREGEVGGLMIFGWYLYHLMTLWTLPAYIAEREAQWLMRRRQSDIPEKMARWSEPLPEDQWAKPSELLKRQSAAVKRVWAKKKQAPLAAVFAEARSLTGDEELQREI